MGSGQGRGLEVGVVTSVTPRTGFLRRGKRYGGGGRVGTGVVLQMLPLAEENPGSSKTIPIHSVITVPGTLG